MFKDHEKIYITNLYTSFAHKILFKQCRVNTAYKMLHIREISFALLWTKMTLHH